MSKNVKKVISITVILAVGITVGVSITNIIATQKAKSELTGTIKVAEEYCSLLDKLIEYEKKDIKKLKENYVIGNDALIDCSETMINTSEENILKYEKLLKASKEVNESIFSTSEERDAVVSLKTYVKDINLEVIKGIVRAAKEDAEE